ncbi:hypothetical protein ACXYTJ_17000 [Gilvimarinus sp. F26214L]|uniref:hypothetical protein n=1 Tax=Gilvimarinus sp. DZF01 TaxID=3461371 RepID=UPI004045FF19
MSKTRKRYLARLPYLPLWVETRDLLLGEDSKLIENATRDGFVVWSPADGTGSVVGEPESYALALAARDVPELLAFTDNIDSVRALLPDFYAEHAAIFSAPEQLPSAPPHRCREISLSEIVAQGHLPDELSSELFHVAEDGVTVVASF